MPCKNGPTWAGPGVDDSLGRRGLPYSLKELSVSSVRYELGEATRAWAGFSPETLDGVLGELPRAGSKGEPPMEIEVFCSPGPWSGGREFLLRMFAALGRGFFGFPLIQAGRIAVSG